MQKTSDNIFILLLLSIGGVFMLVVSFVVIFIRHQNKLLRQQRQIQQAEIAHQKELLQTVIESEETERKRIGQDLHDDVGTALSNLRITIEMFNRSTSADLDRFKNSCKSIIDKVILDVRNISHNLSPAGILLYGFIGALEELSEFVTLHSGLQVSISNKAGDLPDRLNEAAAISLYRVMEELLNNTIKHAGANRAYISFETEGDYMSVSYQDDGRGMPKNIKTKNGIGLQNIESRLGIIGADFTMGQNQLSGFSMLIKIIPVI